VTVYAVLAHGDPTTFNYTAQVLRPHPLVVHVDASHALDGYLRADHITYVSNRVNVHWGGFSVVEATLRLYDAALSRASADEHVVLLSGQCVPVQPVERIEAAIATSSWRQHCAAGLLLDGLDRNENRVRRTWLFDRFDARVNGPRHALNALARRMVSLIVPKRPMKGFEGLTVAAGSQWTAFTADCLEAMLQEGELVNRLKRLLRYSLAPDEIFFHTLLQTTGWSRQSATPDPLVKGTKPTAAFANLHYIDPSLTRYLTPDDLAFAASAGALFARKVELRDRPDLANLLARLTDADKRGQTGYQR
jgi:hypothetical protein